MTTENLLIELLIEELPPRALASLGEAFAAGIVAQLQDQGLLTQDSQSQAFATPRRLAVLVQAVLAQAPARTLSHRLMPVRVGLDAAGKPTPALLKKLRSLGVADTALAASVAQLKKHAGGKDEMLFLHTKVAGMMVAQGAQNALSHVLANLPIPKLMSYQLTKDCTFPGWDTVHFVRPAHGLLALYGGAVLPLTALGLQAARSTQGHRFEAAENPVVIAHANAYEGSLEQAGAVLASFSKRKASIQSQLQACAAKLGLQLKDDAALLDEVTALVERPNVLVCQFDEAFLSVPMECLILTMKANQKYFPLFTPGGQLSHYFLLVSNINPQNPSQVISGNERVVRPRLADARFFYEQDLKKTLEARVPDLRKVVYHNQLGTQFERSERVAAIATLVVKQWCDAQPHYDATVRSEMEMLAFKVKQAARLAKCDLLTEMVGEFPALQGIMGAYYARHEGLKDGVAIAIEDHYKPRFAGDTLPRNRTGTALALADKLETLVGMFGIGNLPSGDKDPYALRRHALGILRIILEKDIPLNLSALLQGTGDIFDGLVTDTQAAAQSVYAFTLERLGSFLREQDYSSNEVEAVLALRLERLNTVGKRLHAVRSFAALPQATVLIAANKRIGNILKKSNAPDTAVQPDLLREDAEKTLYAALQSALPTVEAAMLKEDYAPALQALAYLKEPVDAFFEHVLVNDSDPALRANRLTLLQALRQAMNQVADISCLAA